MCDVRGRRSRGPLVLMYHGFTAVRRDDDPENLFVEVARFEEQLRWLLDHGWRPLSEADYLDARAGRRRFPRRSFLLTIDDALASVAEIAAPVLDRLGVPGVLYVPVGLAGGTAAWLPEPRDEPILDAPCLRKLHEVSTLSLGVHGWDHSDLREHVDLDTQLVRARRDLEAVIGAPVRTFAYPFGAHDAVARDRVRDAGYELAFSVFDDRGPYAVSRVDVNATDTLASFRLKLVPGYRILWRLTSHLPVLRRTVRRITTFTRQRAL